MFKKLMSFNINDEMQNLKDSLTTYKPKAKVVAGGLASPKKHVKFSDASNIVHNI
jgi:hypothetical protein